MKEPACEVVIGERGRVVRPSLHDGYLVGMALGDDKDDKSVVIFLRSDSGQSYELELRGLDMLRADEFLEGNIICGIYISAGKDVSDKDICSVYGLVGGPNDGHCLQVEKKKVHDLGLMHLSITPSYGCSLRAIFRDYEFRPAAPPV